MRTFGHHSCRARGTVGKSRRAAGTIATWLALLSAVACSSAPSGPEGATGPASTTPDGAARHPLDPLTAAEMQAVLAVLEESGRTTPATRFGALHLDEPSKEQVGRALESGELQRRAFALLYDWSTRVTSEAVVDLSSSELLSWRDVHEGPPPLRSMITMRANEVLRADPDWQEALAKRNIPDPSRILAVPIVGEGQSLDEREGDLFVGVSALHLDEPPPAMRVGGLNAGINLSRGEISRFVDLFDGMDPKPDYGDDRLLASEERRPAPLRIEGPEGPGFEIDGSEVRWDRWRFHFGVHPRRGLEIFDVAVVDDGSRRQVLYRASVNEIITPYGAPSFGSWYPRDLGDYGLAFYGHTPIVAGADAQANAVLVDAAVHDDHGRPVTVPAAVALYERDGGLLWRHGNESRRARQLVVASVYQVDNYDYLFRWVFSQDGALDVEVELSGVINFESTDQRQDRADAPGDRAVFSRLVAPEVGGPNHQHFFSFRLDFDIEGPGADSVLELDTVPVPRGAENPDGEWFAMRERLLDSEAEAQRSLDLASSRKWRVITSDARNELGQFAGYDLVPGENAVPRFAPDSIPRRRAGFVNAHLWVTPWSPDEVYPAGEYPNFAELDRGLMEWTRADRPLSGRDVVVWYTLGVTHVPRAEDWPIMPAHRAGFRLVPSGFFSRNPALEVPRDVRR